MKLVSFCVISVVLYLILTNQVPAAEPSKLSLELWQKAQIQGTARVIVEFDMPWQVEARLNPAARLAQRNNIAANQKAIISELGPSVRKVTGAFQTVSGMGLEVDSRGLFILMNSPRVKRIIEVLPERASAFRN